MCCLKAGYGDNGDRLLQKLGQYQVLLAGLREMKGQGFSLIRTKSS